MPDETGKPLGAYTSPSKYPLYPDLVGLMFSLFANHLLLSALIVELSAVGTSVILAEPSSLVGSV